jgi:hypothetical protein
MESIIIYLSMLFLFGTTADYPEVTFPESAPLARESPVYGNRPFISGKVSDRKTGMPIGKVIVRWDGTPDAVLTRADGTYRIAAKPEIKKLVFSKPGWEVKKARVKSKGDTNVKLKSRKLEPMPPQPMEDMPPDTLRRISSLPNPRSASRFVSNI